MGSRAKRWVFTLNNYTEEELLALHHIDGHVDYLVFAKEVGENGTPHLQGYVCFPDQKRLNAVKEILGNRCHVEVSRGTPDQASKYCKKPTTLASDIYEYGTLPGPQGRRTDLNNFFEWGKEFIDEHGRPPVTPEAARLHPEVVTKYPRCTKTLRMMFEPTIPEGAELRPWQQELNDELEAPADDRSIIFYVDEQGNKGKSWFQRWFTDTHPFAQMLAPGKRDDIAHAVDESKSVFLFNVCRDQMQYLQYTVIEALKDKTVFSPKYMSTMKRLQTTPHVVVFSNEYPDMTKLSEDRYVIRNI